MKRKRRFVYFFAAAILLCGVLGSRTAPAGDDWLPVPPEDLALKQNPASPGTDAMILFRSSEILTSDATVAEYVRVKIFTAEGLKYGDVQLSYRKGLSEIQDVRARTIRPNGEVINWDGKTFDATTLKYRDYETMAKKFTLPALEPGCIIEYRYREHFVSRYVDLSWVLQEKLFTRVGSFSIRSPGHSAYPLFFRHFNLPPNTTPQRQSDGSYTLEVHDMPGLAEEAYMPPATALRARVEFFYRNPRDPANETTDQYWARVGKIWSGDLDQFLNNSKLLNSEAAKATSPSDSPEAKLKKLCARVQAIRDLSFETAKSKKEEQAENLKPNNNVEDVLKHGYGTSRDINWLFVGLVRAAGFQASMVYLAPRNRDYFMPELQDAKQLQAEAVWVHAGDAEYYLDPAARFFPFGMLPWYETQASGVRVNKNGADIVTTPLPPSSDAVLKRKADLQIDEEGTVSGTLEVEYGGQRAALWREDERTEDETGLHKKFETAAKSWLPADATFELKSVSNWEKVDEPIKLEGTVKIPGFATSAGRRLLMPATIFKASQTKGFASANRVNMVYFHYPYEESDEVKMKVPAGFKLETTPEKRQVGGGPVHYELSASASGEEVEVKRSLIVSGISFPVGSYAGLRTFFNTAESNDDTQVVFQTSETAKNN